MAEILGVGLSHYPGPLVEPEFWPRMLVHNVEIGRIKPELFEDRGRWPAPMLAEWGDDGGITAAAAHRDRLVAGFRALRAQLDAFAPDLVLIWGDDQFENFQQDCIPPFCIGLFDEAVCTPYGGARFSFQTEQNVWGIAPETELRLACHSEAAFGACRALLDDGFDLAYSLALRHPRGLAHSFVRAILFLDYDRAGFTYPIKPIHVNCYGNDLLRTGAVSAGKTINRIAPPSPSPKRCFEIGAAIARYFAASPWRVALISSSSWSHGSLTQKHGRLYPDLEADRARLADLQTGRHTTWGEIARSAIEDAGQHEILNWICLAGAMTELGQTASVVDYVESHVFNSSKCFAYFQPKTDDAVGSARAAATSPVGAPS